MICPDCEKELKKAYYDDVEVEGVREIEEKLYCDECGYEEWQ